MNDQAIQQEIQGDLIGSRAMLEAFCANITHELYFTAFDGVSGASTADGGIFVGEEEINNPLRLLTFCVLILRNGFTVTGESVCASPENFNPKIARNIARKHAEQKVLPLMAYTLKQQLHEAGSAKAQPAPGAAHAGYSTMQPHQQRVVDELAELNDKLCKLEAFADTTVFAGLDEAEQDRLRQQYGAMAAYSAILGERIAAFAPVAAH